MWPDDDIEDLILGERPTLLEADKGNELIKALNALRNITITPGQVDEVKYADDEVAIVYKGGGGTGKTIKVIDAEDVTKQYEIVWNENGFLESITVSTSEWEEKEITICEDGSAVAVTFLVKS
tara:strand:+ start:1992 stop:2360 length:369 start_codon:yes stop_codon:yes gene_type:complete